MTTHSTCTLEPLTTFLTHLHDHQGGNIHHLEIQLSPAALHRQATQRDPDAYQQFDKSLEKFGRVFARWPEFVEKDGELTITEVVMKGSAGLRGKPAPTARNFVEMRLGVQGAIARGRMYGKARLAERAKEGSASREGRCENKTDTGPDEIVGSAR